MADNARKTVDLRSQKQLNAVAKLFDEIPLSEIFIRNNEAFNPPSSMASPAKLQEWIELSNRHLADLLEVLRQANAEFTGKESIVKKVKTLKGKDSFNSQETNLYTLCKTLFENNGTDQLLIDKLRQNPLQYIDALDPAQKAELIGKRIPHNEKSRPRLSTGESGARKDGLAGGAAGISAFKAAKESGSDSLLIRTFPTSGFSALIAPVLDLLVGLAAMKDFYDDFKDWQQGKGLAGTRMRTHAAIGVASFVSVGMAAAYIFGATSLIAFPITVAALPIVSYAATYTLAKRAVNKLKTEITELDKDINVELPQLKAKRSALLDNCKDSELFLKLKTAIENKNAAEICRLIEKQPNPILKNTLNEIVKIELKLEGMKHQQVELNTKLINFQKKQLLVGANLIGSVLICAAAVAFFTFPPATILFTAAALVVMGVSALASLIDYKTNFMSRVINYFKEDKPNSDHDSSVRITQKLVAEQGYSVDRQEISVQAPILPIAPPAAVIGAKDVSPVPPPVLPPPPAITPPDEDILSGHRFKK